MKARTVGQVAFVGALALAPTPMRRWMVSMFLLVVAIIYTVQSPHEYWDHTGQYPDSYRFPWYCIALIIIFCVWGVFGYIRAWRLCHTVYRDQLPLERLRRFTNQRVLIAYDGTPQQPQPPQSPTAPSPATYGPPPAPGSGPAPTWVPTYSGPSKPVQRIEISTGGIVMRDHRGVDPDDL